MLTGNIVTCEPCVSGIYIIEICWLGVPDSCSVRGITYLTTRKRSNSFEKLLKPGCSENVIMVQFLRHQPGKLDAYREFGDFYLMEAISYRIERSWCSVEIDSV